VRLGYEFFHAVSCERIDAAFIALTFLGCFGCAPLSADKSMPILRRSAQHDKTVRALVDT
jgi:hypothetical protein